MAKISSALVGGTTAMGNVCDSTTAQCNNVRMKGSGHGSTTLESMKNLHFVAHHIPHARLAALCISTSCSSF